MALPYEILIRSSDGKYSGAHVLDTPSSPARAIKESDWPKLVKEINQAALDASAEVDGLKKQLEEGKAILLAHQAESDRLATQAEAAFAVGDVAALTGIIAAAKLFGAAREKKKLMEEAENLEAKAAELKEKADSI